MEPLNWQAPEFDYRSKDVSWYWMSIIIAVLLLGFAVWQKNFPFGFFIIVAEILILVWANAEPPVIHFEMNEKGVRIGNNTFHAFSEFVNFSAEETGSEWVHIFFEFNRPRPKLKIRVPKDLAPDARAAVKKYLKETQHNPSLAESIEELIGF